MRTRGFVATTRQTDRIIVSARARHPNSFSLVSKFLAYVGKAHSFDALRNKCWKIGDLQIWYALGLFPGQMLATSGRYYEEWHSRRDTRCVLMLLRYECRTCTPWYCTLSFHDFHATHTSDKRDYICGVSILA